MTKIRNNRENKVNLILYSKMMPLFLYEKSAHVALNSILSALWKKFNYFISYKFYYIPFVSTFINISNSNSFIKNVKLYYRY